MNLFAPILTPLARMSVVTDDMPLYTVRDIPNMSIYLMPKDKDSVDDIITVPYKAMGITRRPSVLEKTIIMMTPLIDAQLETPGFIEQYGACDIVTQDGKRNTRRALDTAFRNSIPHASSIFYQVHTEGKTKTFSNSLSLSISNGVSLRTYPTEEEWKKRSDPTRRNELHGMCHIFGREAFCVLTHEFFRMERISNDIWIKAVEERVQEGFPFLTPTGMFHSLKFELG